MMQWMIGLALGGYVLVWLCVLYTCCAAVLRMRRDGLFCRPGDGWMMRVLYEAIGWTFAALYSVIWPLMALSLLVERVWKGRRDA